jgi:hypothetical protein
VLAAWSSGLISAFRMRVVRSNPASALGGRFLAKEKKEKLSPGHCYHHYFRQFSPSFCIKLALSYKKYYDLFSTVISEI